MRVSSPSPGDNDNSTLDMVVEETVGLPTEPAEIHICDDIKINRNSTSL